jgi:hypothetical protein
MNDEERGAETAPQLGTGPRVVRREEWVELPKEYAGFKFRLWVNAPTRLWNDVTSGDEERGRAALAKIVLEHNGWCDFDGAVYPPTTAPEFWEAIPTELLAVMLVVSQAEMGKLPNSLAPRKRR